MEVDVPQAFGLYYHESGSSVKGTPLLLHGAGGNHLYWPPEIRRKNEYRILALDLPGHGKSSETSGLQSIQEYVDAVYAWIQAMDIHQFVIAGHSMGGAIALSLALQFPAHLAGLVLISTGARLPVSPMLLAETSSSALYLKAVHRIMEWSFSPDAPPRLVELAYRRMAESRQSVLHSDLKACAEFNVVDQLDKISCPTLVLCGEKDLMTPRRSSQYLASRIPRAQLHLVAGAGHMVMLEQPHTVAEAVHGFVMHLVQPQERR